MIRASLFSNITTLLLLVQLIQFAYSDDQLLLVIEHFRHGARGPLKNSYDSNQQTYQSGQLTDVGQNQQYQLALQLRNEYIINKQFLRPYYNHTEIVIYSTDVNRTIMSAYAHLLGLYGAGTGPILSVTNQTLLTPPYLGGTYIPMTGEYSQYALPYGMNVFPVHTVPKEGSLMPFNCPNYDKLADRNLKKYGDFIKNLNKVCSTLYSDVSSMIGESITNLQELMNFEDVMTADIYQQRPLPSGLTQDYINKINILRAISWFVYQTGDVMKALSANTFNFYLGEFEKKLNNTSTYKYIVLSGHDSTMSRQLLNLNISNHECQWQKYLNQPITGLNCEDSPRFASNLIYELYSSESNPNQPYIMVKYNNKYVNLCEKQQTKCNYAEFSQRIRNSIGNYEDMCGINTGKEKDDQETVIQALAIISVVLTITCALLGYALYKMKQDAKRDQLSQDPIHSPLYNQSDMNRFIEMDKV